MLLRCVLVWLSLFATYSCTDGKIYNPVRTKQILDETIFSENYDPRIRPTGSNITTGNPLDVIIDLHVLKITKIDEEKMTFTLDTFFRENWIDERLSFKEPSTYLTLNEDEVIWRPDIFFNTYKEYHHDAVRQNTLLRIYPNGSILLSKRYTLVLYCEMDLSKFPFDIQTCSLKIELYAWNANDITLRWKDNSVSVSANALTENFKLNSFYTTSEGVKVSTGNYTRLELVFELRRESQYYIFFVFIPCTIMVLIAYGCLWIDNMHFTSRLVISLSTLYILTQSLASINQQILKLPYVKAVDVYTSMSITFVLIVLMETIFNSFIMEKQRADKNKLIVNGDSKKVENISNGYLLKKCLLKKSANTIDSTLRVLLPILYILFQVIFWGVCLL